MSKTTKINTKTPLYAIRAWLREDGYDDDAIAHAREIKVAEREGRLVWTSRHIVIVGGVDRASYRWRTCR
jgi:hypothetical protein